MLKIRAIYGDQSLMKGPHINEGTGPSAERKAYRVNGESAVSLFPLGEKVSFGVFPLSWHSLGTDIFSLSMVRRSLFH